MLAHVLAYMLAHMFAYMLVYISAYMLAQKLAFLAPSNLKEIIFDIGSPADGFKN